MANGKSVPYDPSVSDRDLVYKAFGEYRSYVRHEDALINERLQRLLIIQGFLFAAEANLLPRWGELLPKLVAHTDYSSTKYGFYLYGIFLILVPLMGIVTAFFVKPALEATRASIVKLGDEWGTKWGSRADTYLLPKLLGGGAPEADKKGHRHIVHITWCFMVVWGFFCLCTLYAEFVFSLNHILGRS